MTEKNQSADKVMVSLTYKVGLPHYGSADAQVSFSSEVRDGETEEEAYSRVLAFVEAKMEEQKAKLEAMADGDSKKPVKAKKIPHTEQEESQAETDLTKTATSKKSEGLLSKLKKVQTPASTSEKVEDAEETEHSQPEEKVEEPQAPKRSKLDELREKYLKPEAAESLDEEKPSERSSLLSKFKR